VTHPRCLPHEAALLVFDWDGTVVDSIHSIATAIQLAAADLGLPVPPEERARHVIGLGLGDALQLAVPSLPASQMQAFVARYRYHYFAGDGIDRPFDGVAALLEALAGAGRSLAVATGKSRAGLERAFDSTRLGPLFVASRCADEGRPKPHPWMLESLAEETGIATSAMIMIGDTSHDIGMARSAGAAAVGVAYGAHDRTEIDRARPDWVVESIAELRLLLERGPAALGASGPDAGGESPGAGLVPPVQR
jgi:phosphoglycolate phosphatase